MRSMHVEHVLGIETRELFGDPAISNVDIYMYAHLKQLTVSSASSTSVHMQPECS